MQRGEFAASLISYGDVRLAGDEKRESFFAQVNFIEYNLLCAHSLHVFSVPFHPTCEFQPFPSCVR